MIPRFLNPAAPILVLALIVAGPSRAHEYWLAPSSFRTAPSDTIALGALAGEGFAGERKPFAPGRVIRWRVRAGRELDLMPASTPGDTVWVRFAPGDGGGLLFGYESNFASLTLDGASFDRYLEEEGLDGPRQARRARGDAGPGRERYRRCAKSYLAGNDSLRALEPLGMPCEIVPLSVPGREPSLRVRVLFEGRPLAGARLGAWRQPFEADGRPRDPVRRDPAPLFWSGRTDARGEAVIPVEAPGEWLLSVVHMVASHDPAAADWESTWASLTFARAERTGVRTKKAGSR